MTDVSTDIETLGTVPGSVVLSIGAVVFDINSNVIYDQFYQNIDIMSSLMYGMTIDTDTVKWWSDPKLDQARDLLVPNRVPLDVALRSFSDWIKMTTMKNIWAKPPKFDIELLEAAYRATKIEVPWNHRQPLCVRTAIRWSEFNDKTMIFDGVEHYALDDARHQARIIQAAKSV